MINTNSPAIAASHQLGTDQSPAAEVRPATPSEIAEKLAAEGEHRKSIPYLRQALFLEPNNWKLANNLGVALRLCDFTDEAEAAFRWAVAVNPDAARFSAINFGACAGDRGDFTAARAFYQQAIDQTPSDIPLACFNMAQTFPDPRDSIPWYDRAIEAKPYFHNAYKNRALCKMALGDLQGAASDYDHRWLSDGWVEPKRFADIPKWRGERPAKVLLWGEQGVGDEILYNQWLPSIEGVQIVREMDSRLHSIYQQNYQFTSFTSPRASVLNTLDITHQLPAGDLPGIFGFPSASDLKIKPLKWDKYSFSEGTVIGLSWRSMNRQYVGQKSLPFTSLGPWLRNGAKWISLDVENPPIRANVWQDLETFFSIVNSCTVVVTCSNTTAHIAGALGKTTLLCLPKGKGSYWYWGQYDRCPIYPSITIFRQETPGDWQPVIDRVAEILKNVK